MVIDFHTHTFPDKIAEQTIAALAAKSGNTPYRGGTLDALRESMRKNGVDYSVILPVATKPSQVPSINRLAASLNGTDGVIYAGCIHPLCEDVEAVLEDIRQSGLFGLKIHPDYQFTDFDDPKYLHILREAAKRDLVVVTHAGVDVGFPDTVRCTPVRNTILLMLSNGEKSIFGPYFFPSTQIVTLRFAKSASNRIW